jgi:HEAT repeat protein
VVAAGTIAPRLLARCALVLLVAGGAGCEVTPEKIEFWKTSERGPGKLRDTVGRRGVPVELRAMAAAGMVEIGAASEMATVVKGLDEADRRALVHATVPRLATLSQDKDASDRMTRKALEAKDALFLLREPAAPEDRGAIDDALLAWLTVDLATRLSAGGQGGEKMLEAIGARAGARLGEVVADASTSDASRMQAAELLGKLGDEAVREQAGARLVDRARRGRNVSEATLREIGLVGGGHAVAYLTALADDGHQTTDVRQKALLALALRGDAASLPAALRLALDRHAPPKVRDAAFEVAEKVGPPAVSGLVRMLGDKDEKVRWRAVEAALTAGKEKAIVPVLEGLPTSIGYSQDDLRSYVVHDLLAVGPAALAPLREGLKSSSWVARLAAVEALGQAGQAEDVARLSALAGDGWKLKGWSGGATIGSEARAAAEALSRKK